jgi:uncharacterized DUF497 family protein
MLDKLHVPKELDFEWDEGNKYKNEEKHKVSNKESEDIFKDNPIFTLDQRHSVKEERWGVLGETSEKRKLFIAFTIRNNKIRIISARDADKAERKWYEEKIKEDTSI